MPAGIELKKCDLVLQWDFVTPAFELLMGTSALFKRAFERLKPRGLRTTEMRILYAEAGNIGTLSLDCRLIADEVLVRFGLERLELIAADCLRVPTGTVFGVALDAARVLKDTFSEGAFKSFSVALGLHGIVPQKSALDLVQRFLTMKSGTDAPLTGVGLNLQFGPQGDTLSSSLLVEPSLLTTGGLYIKSVTVLDATRVPPEQVREIALSRLQGSLALIGLAAHVP